MAAQGAAPLGPRKEELQREIQRSIASGLRRELLEVQDAALVGVRRELGEVRASAEQPRTLRLEAALSQCQEQIAGVKAMLAAKGRFSELEPACTPASAHKQLHLANLLQVLELESECKPGKAKKQLQGRLTEREPECKPGPAKKHSQVAGVPHKQLQDALGELRAALAQKASKATVDAMSADLRRQYEDLHSSVWREVRQVHSILGKKASTQQLDSALSVLRTEFAVAIGSS